MPGGRRRAAGSRSWGVSCGTLQLRAPTGLDTNAPETTTMAGSTSLETYNKLVESFRKKPGNITQAAQFAGCKWETAKRAWAGPAWRFRPDMPPIRAFLEGEDKLQREAREAEEARAAAEVEAARRRKEELRQEAQKAEENILRLARSTTLQGIGGLAQMAKGVGLLSKRIGDQLETGLDAQGNPLNIDPLNAINLIRQFGTTLNRFTDAAQALIAIERLREGLPTDLVGVTVTHDVTLGQVEESLGDAARALDRARRLELIPGGKPEKKSG